MGFALRQASLSDDREEMIALLGRNFPSFDMASHFRWRHESNPAGTGWSWVVCDAKSGTIGAMTSLFPRPMYLDGKLVTCGQVGEFAVDSGYRSLGPAVMLQRATFAPVDSGELQLCYDCPPHDQGMSTFVRLGMRPSCEMTRYAYLVRSDQIVEKRFGTRFWTKALVGFANFALNTRPANHAVAGLEVCALHRDFDDEFTHLDQMIPSNGIIRLSRSAKMLNWRYRERSDLAVEVVVARSKGELQGFLAFEVYEERRASIRDLFGRNLNSIGVPLLYAAIELCRRKKVVCLEGYCSQTSELNAVFTTAGFRPRERAARVVAYARRGDYRAVLNSSAFWPMGQAELNA